MDTLIETLEAVMAGYAGQDLTRSYEPAPRASNGPALL
jgi:hypothetical protein